MYVPQALTGHRHNSSEDPYIVNKGLDNKPPRKLIRVRLCLGPGLRKIRKINVKKREKYPGEKA